jgi:deazaflavin-dependent oxidoreductase (nitroreductase family)
MSDFNAPIIEEFRANGGTVATMGFGDHLVLVHSLGAKSGLERVNPVLGIPEGDSWLVIASAAGSPKDPAWAYNLRAHPQVDIEVPAEGGAKVVPVTVSELPDGEWPAAWKRFTDQSPGFLEYTKTAQGRRFPIFRLTRR